MDPFAQYSDRNSDVHRRGPTFNVDTASDTSSARERRFDELLGEEPQYEQVRPSPYRGAAHSHKLHEIGVATVRAKQEWLKMERDRMLMQELSQLTQRPNITAQA